MTERSDAMCVNLKVQLRRFGAVEQIESLLGHVSEQAVAKVTAAGFNIQSRRGALYFVACYMQRHDGTPLATRRRVAILMACMAGHWYDKGVEPKWLDTLNSLSFASDYSVEEVAKATSMFETWLNAYRAEKSQRSITNVVLAKARGF